MKKKLSLLMIALVAIAAFAVQVGRRAADSVTLEVPTETELGAYIAENVAANPSAAITLKLAAGGTYTVTTDPGQLPVDATFTITTDANNPATIKWSNKPLRAGKGLTFENVIIDASEASGHIVSMNDPRAEGSAWEAATSTADESGNKFWTLDTYKFENIRVLGLNKCLLFDNGKNGFIFNEVIFNNCIVQLRGGSDSKNVPINLNNSSFGKLTVSNSTFYGLETTAYANFMQLGGKRIWETPDNTEKTSNVIFENNTFYNVALGSKMLINANTLKGQANAKFNFKKNIFANTPDQSKMIYKNVTNASAYENQITAEDNTYVVLAEDAEATFWNETSHGSDEGILADPKFKDAANGDFTLGDCEQYTKETGDPRWIVKVTKDVTIAPESGDIAAALTAAKEELAYNEVLGNITINLTAGAAYTVSAPIVAPASLTINGAAGAVIDASALETAMITTPAGDLTLWKEVSLTIKDVTIKGVKKGVFASAGKNYLYNDFLIDNSVIEIAATGGLEFDFRKGGVAKNFTINKSTIYAPTATTNSLYTSQSAQKGTEAPGVTVQTFTITNSTLYNIAKGKNFFTHRQSNQKWLAFTIKNSVFLNVGKSGQVVKGINQGQSGANPTWDIDGNIFNFEGKDTSADESTGDDDEPVKNSVAGRALFKDTAKGDFGGKFVLAPTVTSMPETIGDPRWTLTSEASFAINIALGIENGTVTTTPAEYAAKDEVVTIKGTPASGFAVESYLVKKGEEDVAVDANATFKMPEADVLVSAVFSKAPVDIVVAADDISGGDITAAIAAKIAALAEGEKVGNITITLAEGNYTVSSSIEAPASLTINGAAGAVIDASALETAMITTPAGDLTLWKEVSLTIKDVTIKGVKKGVFASAGKNYLYNDFLIDNSVIEIAATGGLEFDFRKGGVAKNFTINKSTIYAPTATTNSLYTSQSAQKGTEAPGVTVQTFTITNSTLYNIAKGKNFFTHRQSNQKWLAFTIKNSVFLNVGKSGQVVKGINQGQSGANPTWDIDGNIFNFEGKDTSADESTGDEAEPVKNSVAGVIAFTDADTGDFNGTFTLAEGATAPETVGDPRWTISYSPTGINVINVNGTDDADTPMYNLSGQRVTKDYKGIVIRNGKKMVVK